MYSAIAVNKRKTIYIMAVFLIFIGGLLWLFNKMYAGGQPTIFYGSLVGSLVYVLISYFAGARMATAVNGAQEIKKSDNPRLWRMVENLAITEGLPMPKVYIMDDPAPNAFATGRNPENAVVCATSGILEIMNDTELQAVLAHEMGHVKNYDIRVTMIAFALTSVISLIADFILRATWFSSSDRENKSPVFMIAGIVAALVAPLVATMIQLAISRQREYLADASSAMATRHPDGLISALQKLEQYGTTLQKQNTATAHLFFANPLKPGMLAGLFSTHPPIPERIARLQEMGGKL